MKIVWSALAQKRMDDIYDWYSVRSESVAARIYNEILDAAESLQQFPGIAAIETALESFTRTYRSLIVLGLFKLVYFIDTENKTIFIATIWDCRQDPERLRSEMKE